MNSKIYQICAIFGTILCLTLCLIFVPNIGALKFLGILVASISTGFVFFDVSYLILYKFLESTNPNDWKFAVMERVFIDGSRKYQPVIKTVKFGDYVNIDKTFLSSVSSETEFDTYKEAEDVIKAFKELEFEQYQEKLKEYKDNKCKPNKKKKVINVIYTEI